MRCTSTHQRVLLPESVSSGIAPRSFLVAAHFCIVIGFAVFFVGHLSLATTGATPLSLIKGMLPGRHERVADAQPTAAKKEGED